MAKRKMGAAESARMNAVKALALTEIGRDIAGMLAKTVGVDDEFHADFAPTLDGGFSVFVEGPWGLATFHLTPDRARMDLEYHKRGGVDGPATVQ